MNKFQGMSFVVSLRKIFPWLLIKSELGPREARIYKEPFPTRQRISFYFQQSQDGFRRRRF